MSGAAFALLLLMAQDRRQLLGELQRFDEQIASLEQQTTALDARLATLQVQRASNVAAQKEAEGGLTARREETKRRVGTLYRLKRRGLARLLFDAEDPFDLRRRVRYLLAVLRADEADNRAYLEQLAARRAASEKVERDVAALEGVKTELEARRRELNAERAERRALIRSVQETPDSAALLARERADAASALTASIAATGAPAAPAEAASFRAEKGRLPPPVPGPVARGFGPYTDPVSGLTVENLGLDFAATLGTPFRAVADGVVTRSAYVRGYGQVVIVQHGSFATLYAHANGLRVAQGQTVKRGDVLGLVGNTGLAEEADARLHFEIRYNNTPQDPSPWLAR